MRFSVSSLSGIFSRYGPLLMLLLSVALTVSVTTYAHDHSTISPTAKHSPTLSQAKWNLFGERSGAPQVRSQRSTEQRARSTSFTASETRPSLATTIRSAYDSAGPIASRSDSSDASTIFTSRNSRITHATGCGRSLRSDSSRTELCYSTSIRTPGRTLSGRAASGSTISRTGKRERSSKIGRAHV